MSANKAEAKVDAKAVEAANEKLVNDFCAAWGRMDLETIGAAIADNLVFQLIDDFPLVEGKEAFLTQAKAFLDPVERAEFEMLRSSAMGKLVINERIDHFWHKDGKEQHFHVTGQFVVRDGKICVWKDYWWPGCELPAPKPQ